MLTNRRRKSRALSLLPPVNPLQTTEPALTFSTKVLSEVLSASSKTPSRDRIVLQTLALNNCATVYYAFIAFFFRFHPSCFEIRFRPCGRSRQQRRRQLRDREVADSQICRGASDGREAASFGGCGHVGRVRRVRAATVRNDRTPDEKSTTVENAVGRPVAGRLFYAKILPYQLISFLSVDLFSRFWSTAAALGHIITYSAFYRRGEQIMTISTSTRRDCAVLYFSISIFNT